MQFRPSSPHRLPLSYRLAPYVVLLCILGACVLIEAALQGADHELWGSRRWRGLAYQNGGFWRGLLDSWRPNYAAQPVTMFASYGFLHGGFWHVTINMITLASLGRPVIDRVGPSRFALIYALSLLGGAAGFAMLSSAVQPMVGASGALFGLVGALIIWDLIDRRTAHVALAPTLKVVALLVLLNLVMYWAMSGQLAWEAHLGGFLAGAAAGAWLRAAG